MPLHRFPPFVVPAMPGTRCATLLAALRLLLVPALVLGTARSSAALADPVVVDSGETPSAWSAIASPTATASIVAGSGDHSGATGLRFDLGRGRSHAIARREVSLDLPDDYMFVFTVESDAEPNTLEIKFISGENVWWRRLADIELPHESKELRVAKQRIAFAWGPAGGGMPTHLDAIEIAVVAGKGGQGTLWIDGITLEPRDENQDRRPPLARTSSAGGDVAALLDGNEGTVWRSDPVDRQPTVTLDFHAAVEQGGLEIDYEYDAKPRAFVVEASLDATSWQEVRRFRRSSGARDAVYLPDLFTRYLRLRYEVEPGRRIAIREILPQPVEFSSSPNGFFTSLARQKAPGMYPRYFLGEQSYWSVVGTDGGRQEALVNEEGSVEVDAGAFTLEPFLETAGGLRTWKETTNEVSLLDGELPIPTVRRRDRSFDLDVTAFAAGHGDDGTLLVRYRVQRHGPERELRLAVALRPFQVLPPWQALNRAGGVTKIARIRRDGDRVEVTGGAGVDSVQRSVVAVTPPDGFGAAPFEEGDIALFLARRDLPPSTDADDEFGHASAAFVWNMTLGEQETREVWLAVPWSAKAPFAVGQRPSQSPAALLDASAASWRRAVDRVPITLPAPVAEWTRSLRSNLAWILVNRDGPAIQPGSRTYERSWIRDGAMTSAALLELGLAGEAKSFLRWYSGWIGKDGWAPCCIDARGADPVPEHDSFGEFLWGAGEVWRFTRDRAFVEELWPKLRAVADCMTRLRQKRLTREYDAPDKRAMRGLLPESISHEGYSARPVHSYWDQAFALRGFADAAMLAGVVGDTDAAGRFAAEHDDMERALRESIRLVMQQRGLDVAPASVELGDFDPTSTAVAFLLGVEDLYPRDALERSFDRYVDDFRARRGLHAPGTGYTAYELRNATPLMLLGRAGAAIELLGTLIDEQRPPAWNQWPEITWLVPTEPQFLGDLPHSWIGSTYVHAIRSLLVSERGASQGQPERLLVGAGVPWSWFAASGDPAAAELRADSLPTWFGSLSLHIVRDGDRAQLDLRAGDRFVLPEGGIRVFAPFGAEVDGITLDGASVRMENGSVPLTRLPATVVFQYKPPLENRR